MKALVKKKWLEALRSRKYKQGSGQLKDNDKYCCLGVLCDLYIQSPSGKKTNAHFDEDNCFVSDLDIEGSVIPDEVKEWAGLYNSDPNIETIKYKDGRSTSLSILNDGCGEIKKHKFYQIARLIERNL